MEEENKEKENNDFAKNLERIQAFSKMMGNGENKTGEMNPADMLKAMEMAKKFSMVMNTLNEEEPDIQAEESRLSEGFFPSRPMKVLKAAIPFLDQEYQKNLYVAVKLMEVNAIRNMDTLTIQSRSSVPAAPGYDKRGAMLRAIKPYFNMEEQKDIDMVLKLIKMKRLMSMMNKEDL